MEDILRYLKDYELVIYVGLALIAIWQIRKFLLAWEELRAAAFGLERESAQSQLNRTAGVLVFLLVLAIFEYALVTFVVPNVQGANPLPTPTLDVLATPTTTLPAATAPSSAPETPEGQAEEQEASPGCVPGQVMISSPEEGETVQDIVEIQGTADIPDFGFYKFEISRMEAQSWLTIQAQDEVKRETELGFWDTTQIDPGQYKLRLVVFDNLGAQREPCVVSVYVDEPTEE
ncbi:MAG: hypothetical protein R6U51_12015 [Anaerolineales bacterium]